MKILELQPGTDAFDNALRGMVRAERINDVVARSGSKRYRQYLHNVQNGYLDEPDVDPRDEYREKAKALVPRALEAYELRHGVTLHRDRIYLHDEFPIAAVPDAVEGQLIGISVHVRQSLDTYRKAVEAGITADLYRRSIAMMVVTRLPFWIHLQYLEDAELAMRKLHENEVEFSKGRAVDLMDSLIAFAMKSRFQATDTVARTGS